MTPSGLYLALMVASAAADLGTETLKVDGASRVGAVGDRLDDEDEKPLRLLARKSIFMAAVGGSSESDESGMRMYPWLREREEAR